MPEQPTGASWFPRRPLSRPQLVLVLIMALSVFAVGILAIIWLVTAILNG